MHLLREGTDEPEERDMHLVRPRRAQLGGEVEADQRSGSETVGPPLATRRALVSNQRR